MKKTVKLVGIIAFIAVIGITFSGCGDKTPTEKPEVKLPVLKTLSFGEVTISSTDLYLDADWTKVVADVVAALERGYSNIAKDFFEVANKATYTTVFAMDKGTEVVVVNSGRECEVKSDGKMYLKASTLTTVNVQPGVDAMINDSTYQSSE